MKIWKTRWLGNVDRRNTDQDRDWSHPSAFPYSGPVFLSFVLFSFEWSHHPAFVFIGRFFMFSFFLLWPPCLKIWLSPPRSLTESTLSHLTIISALPDPLCRPSIDQQISNKDSLLESYLYILRLLGKEHTHKICDSIMLCLLSLTWWHSWWT